MRTWLSWVWPAASLAAVVAACGGGNGTNSGGFTTDGGENGDSASSSSGGASSSSSGAGGDDSSSSGSSGGTSSSGGSSSGPNDASLDISFPDAFTMPDSSSGSTSSSGGGDGSMPCSPNGVTCSGTVELICNNGTLTTTDCAKETVPHQCANGYGCVLCTPGTGSCNGNVGTSCNAQGTGTVTNNCDPQLGETCNASNGECAGDCASVGSSYIGCEYYAITMSNEELNQSAFFYSVSISNTSTKSATIVITGPSYNQTFTLAAGAIQNFQLPWVSSLSCPGGGCTGALPPMPGTVVVAGGAYHIKSTEPVTVYQFNAYDYTLNGNYSFTNDASLLIPVNAMTGNYYVMGHPTWGYNSPSVEEPGTLAIVGTQANTQVTVNLRAGQSISTGGGVNNATGSNTVTIGAGDVLQIQSAQNAPQPGYGSDVSGSTVTASAPVEVFGGSDCTFIPATQWACDHIEEINFPLETLRNDYLVTLPYNVNAPQSAGSPSWGRQFVKIVGTANGTTLAADPPQAGLTSPINAGQVVYIEATTHFHLTSNNPVIVGQYMESTYQFGTACVNSAAGSGPQDCGDPAMSLAVATPQFRTSYQFIAPPSYSENWVNVIAPNGATVKVDGNTVSGYVGIGSASGYQVAHVSLCSGGCSGVHTATSTVPFGIEVYGYGVYTSYMYPGGLNLTRQ
ncbi:MAG TPA: IgGFc-binding protein [Polyangiaceae bacterium]|nr:IgGFc-binding protein [Polyangiaceae bacterium]